jgi:WD40 repeat protein
MSAVESRDIDINNLFVTSTDDDERGAIFHLLDTNTFATVGELVCPHEYPYGFACAAFSFDNTLLATGNAETVIFVWNVASLSEFARLDNGSPVINIGFPHRHKDTIISLNKDGFECDIVVWNLITLQQDHVIPLTDIRRLSGVFFSRDDRSFYCCVEGTLHVWDCETAVEMGKFSLGATFEKHIYFLTESPSNANEIAFVLGDNELVVWDTALTRTKLTANISAVKVQSLCYAHDGSRLYMFTNNDEILMFDLMTSANEKLLDLGETCGELGLSPDGTRLIVQVDNGRIRAFETESMIQITALQSGEGLAFCFSRPPTVIMM